MNIVKSTIAVALVFAPAAAFAQAVVAAPPAIDLTGIATSVIAGIFGLLAIIIPLVINSHVKDQAAAATLNNAVKNSLGAIQQAATTGIKAMAPSVNLPSSTPPDIVVGVQYALDHAGDEAKRLGITQDMLASKISAQIGLAKIQANVAGTATSPAVMPVGAAGGAIAPVVPAPVLATT